MEHAHNLLWFVIGVLFGWVLTYCLRYVAMVPFIAGISVPITLIAEFALILLFWRMSHAFTLGYVLYILFDVIQKFGVLKLFGL